MRNPDQYLSHWVELSAHYQRSTRIDIDFDKSDALDGYLQQPTAINVLETMARQIGRSNQRAFTWTGPFGGGKSSLALLVSALSSPNEHLKQRASEILKESGAETAMSVFCSPNQWSCVPITGRRASISELIQEALLRFEQKPFQSKNSIDLFKRIETLSHETKSGIIIILDELGKMLEHMASEGEDIFLLQDLAELFARSERPLVLIGILHQSFEQYASRLGQTAREEWSKVQGRFVDLPFVAAADEVVSLVSRAINAKYPHPKGDRLAETVFRELKSRRPNLSEEVLDDLKGAWPMHPIVTIILGPASRKQYGQNERSLFGFIGSTEPNGFNDFLSQSDFDADLPYTPARYWDYLKTNFEPQILASSDSHRWALSVNTLERAEARFDKQHLLILKTIAILELFRDGSGLIATESLLETCCTQSLSELRQNLADLSRASLIVYRKHLSSWALYAGSDFNIEEELALAIGTSTSVPIDLFAKIVGPTPIVAKRHYFEKGCLRWFSKAVLLLSTIENSGAEILESGSTGLFCLVLPDQDISSRREQGLRVAALAKRFRENETFRGKAVILGLAKAESNQLLLSTARELAALLQILNTNPELGGDAVARVELNGRIEASRSLLVTELDRASAAADWYFDSEKKIEFVRKIGLTTIASKVLSQIFSKCPSIDNELLNRNHLSGPATRARKDLCYRMLRYGAKPDLGYTSMSADAGLYYSILKQHKIHRVEGGIGVFKCARNDENLGALWIAADKLLLANKDKGVSLAELHQAWSSEPIGLQVAIGALMSFALLMSATDSYALFIDEIFVPKISEIHIDEILHEPARGRIKLISLEEDQASLLQELSNRFSEERDELFSITPLEAARMLVTRTMQLPAWTRRTRKLSEETKQIRALLTKASDPYTLLFRDLPATFPKHSARELAESIYRGIVEMEAALPNELASVWQAVSSALNVGQVDYRTINMRAANIIGTSGNARLNGFLVHLKDFSATDAQMLALVTAGAGRSERDLTDMDFQSAKNQLLSWAVEFRSLELIAHFNGRDKERILVNVGIGMNGEEADVLRQFTISTDQDRLAKQVSELILDIIAKNGMGEEVALAALAKASLKISKGIQ